MCLLGISRDLSLNEPMLLQTQSDAVGLHTAAICFFALSEAFAFGMDVRECCHFVEQRIG